MSHAPHPLAVRMEEPMSDERLAKIRRRCAEWAYPLAAELLAEVERTRVNAALGAALLAAIAQMPGGEAFHVRRFTKPDGSTYQVVVSALHVRDGGAALDALAALLSVFPPREGETA